MFQGVDHFASQLNFRIGDLGLTELVVNVIRREYTGVRCQMYGKKLQNDIVHRIKSWFPH